MEIWEEDFLYFHIRSFPKAIYVLWYSCICNHHRGYFCLLLIYCFQTDRHNITETLLKVALNTITTPCLPITQQLSQQCKLNWFIWTSVKIPKDLYHHFFKDVCTKSGSLRCSLFSGCWLNLSVYILMSFDFPFVRLFGVR